MRKRKVYYSTVAIFELDVPDHVDEDDEEAYIDDQACEFMICAALKSDPVFDVTGGEVVEVWTTDEPIHPIMG